MTNSDITTAQQATDADAGTGTGTGTGLRPYRISVPQAEIDDLRDRLARTRWTRDLPGTGCAMQQWQERSGAYMQLQGTRPQTIAHALTDSPAGLLAWIVDKFQDWSNPDAQLPEDAVDRDRILTDVSIYWFTGTAGSAAHTYYERFNDPAMWAPKERSMVPTAVAVFPTDLSVRRFADKPNNVAHWSEFGRGGHFAALEAPDLLTADVREFFRSQD